MIFIIKNKVILVNKCLLRLKILKNNNKINIIINMINISNKMIINNKINNLIIKIIIKIIIILENKRKMLMKW